MHLFFISFFIPALVGVATVFSVFWDPEANGALHQNELNHENLNNFTHKQILHQQSPPTENYYGLGVKYMPHLETFGWQGWSRNGEMAGTTGQSRRLEAIRIELYGNNFEISQSQYPNLSIRYKAHGQDYGWQDWVQDGEIAGTTGQSLRMEAIQIELVNAPPGLHIRYRTHLQAFGYGWGPWAQDGQVSGTTGQSRRLEAIQIELFDEF